MPYKHVRVTTEIHPSTCKAYLQYIMLYKAKDVPLEESVVTQSDDVSDVSDLTTLRGITVCSSVDASDLHAVKF